LWAQAEQFAEDAYALAPAHLNAYTPKSVRFQQESPSAIEPLGSLPVLAQTALSAPCVRFPPSPPVFSGVPFSMFGNVGSLSLEELERQVGGGCVYEDGNDRMAILTALSDGLREFRWAAALVRRQGDTWARTLRLDSPPPFIVAPLGTPIDDPEFESALTYLCTVYGQCGTAVMEDVHMFLDGGRAFL